jgi:two-component system, OmpR family, response regulator MtrA
MSLPGARRPTILVVEDDPPTARALADALDMAGYRVWHAVDGADARGQLERARPDMILLDLILPDIDGLVLCYTLKSAANVPIVVCSGSSRKRDPILALKLGADDFVRKPFDLDDLLARVEAVLRRAPRLPGGPPAAPELRVGELLVEPARHRVLLGNELLALTPTEFRLITVMATRPGQVLSRDELGQEVWGYTDVAHGRAIDVHVRRLRMKLQRTSVPAPAIVSVRGSGYRLTAHETATSAA